MTQLNWSGDELMEMWNDCTRLTRECNELKVENQILNDWVRRLEYRIQQLEEAQ